ncbi:hypothetical protein AB1484_27230 [Parafrankia sp. FMc6]|uniref:hypothetical protein n=1 Tax=Parafrankia soli TaxID=2599596 RepID=UPI0034D49453
MIRTVNTHTLEIGEMEGVVEDLIKDWGYDPAEHGDLVRATATTILEDAVDTAYELMRKHGLRGPADVTG